MAEELVLVAHCISMKSRHPGSKTFRRSERNDLNEAGGAVERFSFGSHPRRKMISIMLCQRVKSVF